MKLKQLGFAFTALFFGWSVQAEIGLASTRNADYRSIVDRNPFGLRPPPPPPAPVMTNAVAPKSDIFLTGISTIMKPKRAFIMTMEKGKPEYYSLSEEESRDGLEVLEIDEVNKTVRIRNSGNETLLSFASHGVKAPATPAPSAVPAPGAPALPGAPQPGMAVQPGMNTVPPGGNPQAFNNGAFTPGGAPSTLGTTTRAIPPRQPRVQMDNGQPINMNPGYQGDYQQPVPQQPQHSMSAEQQAAMMELQRMQDPRLPPTPGMHSPGVPAPEPTQPPVPGYGFQ